MKAATLALTILLAAVVAWLSLRVAPEAPAAAASSRPRAASPRVAGERSPAELAGVAALPASELALESGPARWSTAAPELARVPAGVVVRRADRLLDGPGHRVTAVVLGPAGGPLAGSTVRLQAGDQRLEADTDERGRAELGPVGPGTAVLSLEAGDLPAGVVPPIDRGLANHVRLAIPADCARPVVLRTAWAGSVYGRVVGPDGAPARDVLVVLETPTGGVEHRLEARTDAAGDYEVGGVQALDYTLAVDATSPGARGRAPPEPQRVAGLAGVAVGAGTLVLGGGNAALEGRLVDADGEPAAGVTVELELALRPGIWGAPGGAGADVSDDEGRFRVRGLRGGTLRVRTGGSAKDAEVVLELGPSEQRVLEDLVVEMGRRGPTPRQQRELDGRVRSAFEKFGYVE